MPNLRVLSGGGKAGGRSRARKTCTQIDFFWFTNLQNKKSQNIVSENDGKGKLWLGS